MCFVLNYKIVGKSISFKIEQKNFYYSSSLKKYYSLRLNITIFRLIFRLLYYIKKKLYLNEESMRGRRSQGYRTGTRTGERSLNKYCRQESHDSTRRSSKRVWVEAFRRVSNSVWRALACMCTGQCCTCARARACSQAPPICRRPYITAGARADKLGKPDQKYDVIYMVIHRNPVIQILQ